MYSIDLRCVLATEVYRIQTQTVEFTNMNLKLNPSEHFTQTFRIQEKSSAIGQFGVLAGKKSAFGLIVKKVIYSVDSGP